MKYQTIVDQLPEGLMVGKEHPTSAQGYLRDVAYSIVRKETDTPTSERIQALTLPEIITRLEKSMTEHKETLFPSKPYFYRSEEAKRVAMERARVNLDREDELYQILARMQREKQCKVYQESMVCDFQKEMDDHMQDHWVLHDVEDSLLNRWGEGNICYYPPRRSSESHMYYTAKLLPKSEEDVPRLRDRLCEIVNELGLSAEFADRYLRPEELKPKVSRPYLLIVARIPVADQKESHKTMSAIDSKLVKDPAWYSSSSSFREAEPSHESCQQLLR